VPESFKTAELCLAAVKQSGGAFNTFQHVPGPLYKEVRARYESAAVDPAPPPVAKPKFCSECGSKEDWERIDAIKDEDIDYSDIPEMKDLSGLRPQQVRNPKAPEKVPVTCNLDADIVEWLKRDGDSYQARLNSILRQAMHNERMVAAAIKRACSRGSGERYWARLCCRGWG
jgi:uncharacterized protein (DUF4415 family)